MKIGKVLGIGLISGLATFSTFSCKKEFRQAENIPSAVEMQINTYNKQSELMLKDTGYHCFGKDTIKITHEFFTNPQKYIKNLNKKATKNTPKKKVGTHTEIQMIPKSGGGFMQIPTLKNDYAPIYKDQIGLIKSDKLFTSDGEDLYVPVEYYGKIDN